MWRVLNIIVLVALGVLISLCVFVVDQTEYAVQMRFGRPVRALVEPGLHGKWPWPIEKVVRFDNRLMVLENPRRSEADREYLTQDEDSGIGKNVVVTTYTCWRIKRDPTAVVRFLQTMGDHASAEARLGDVVVSQLGASLGQHDFSVLVSTDPNQRNWVGFLDTIQKRCSERVEEAYGIEIVDVAIQRLNFPEQNRRNVFDRMRAERDTIAARYRSQGDQQATEIIAQANRQRAEILAGANEKAVQVRGQADAAAARIYAEAYGQAPQFYEFLSTLETYKKTLTDGTVWIAPGDSAFLELLNRSSKQPESQQPQLDSHQATPRAPGQSVEH